MGVSQNEGVMTQFGIRHLVYMGAIFFKIGSFTFGGGYAMIPLIRREIVESKKWLDDKDFLDMLAVAQSCPGPVAVNTSILVGYRLAGWAGAAVATLGTVLPSFLIILLVAAFFTRIEHLSTVKSIFMGVRPAVVALVFYAAWSIGKKVLNNPRVGLVVAIAFVVLMLRVHPIIVIALGGVAGYMTNALSANRRRKGDQPD